MLCFDKQTGEHNNKKHFKKFSFGGNISLRSSDNLFSTTVQHVAMKVNVGLGINKNKVICCHGVLQYF